MQRLSWVPSELQTHGEGPGETRECWFPTLCSTEEFLPPASQHSSRSAVSAGRRVQPNAECMAIGSRYKKKKIF